MTRNEQYWKKRAERRMDGYVLSAEEQAKVIRRSYNRTRAYVQSEIEKILHHVGDVDSPAYEYRMKRLASLLQNTEKRIKELYGITLEDTTSFLKSIIPEAYYHTIFDIAQGTGIEPSFAAVNEKLINAIVSEPWSGKNYSKRIWSNMDKLETELRDVLTDAAMSGESIGKTSRKVAESFNTASYNAERLIRTETTYACNQAELASYEELDIDRYKYVATLDTRTSPICQKMDGKIFETEKARAGLNLPAMHPNCRSTTIPYFEDFEPEERAARDADGKPIRVPANMTYPEWYDKYVKPKEEQNAPKTPSKPPKGNNTIPRPEPRKTPARTPERAPAEIDIPAPSAGEPEYRDTAIPKPKFTPARTKEEVIETAKQFAEDVNLEGLSRSFYNKVNESMYELTEKYPIRKLKTIETTSRGNGAMAANYERLRINKNEVTKALNNSSTNFMRNQETSANSIDLIKMHWEGKRMPPAIQKQVAQLEDELKFNRWSVMDSYDDKVKACVTHEYGHIIADQYFGQINGKDANPNFATNPKLREMNAKWEATFQRAIDSGDIHNLSRYGRTNAREFFAESFAAREMGEKLPDYVETLMKEVLKNGIM